MVTHSVMTNHFWYLNSPPAPHCNCLASYK